MKWQVVLNDCAAKITLEREMNKYKYEWNNREKSARVGGEEIGQLTGKDTGSEVKTQKTLVLREVLQECKGPRIIFRYKMTVMRMPEEEQEEAESF